MARKKTRKQKQQQHKQQQHKQKKVSTDYVEEPYSKVYKKLKIDMKVAIQTNDSLTTQEIDVANKKSNKIALEKLQDIKRYRHIAIEKGLIITVCALIKNNEIYFGYARYSDRKDTTFSRPRGREIATGRAYNRPAYSKNIVEPSKVTTRTIDDLLDIEFPNKNKKVVLAKVEEWFGTRGKLRRESEKMEYHLKLIDATRVKMIKIAKEFGLDAMNSDLKITEKDLI
jgi:hypothetical protein